MMPIVPVIVYIVGASYSVLSQDVIEEQCGPVIYLNAMFRHGARNPDLLPPNDPYSDLKYWPGGLGALTAEGIRQHYRLGKWMAERYHHLLPDDYVEINNALKVVSTDWNRTLMSAQAKMAGMFPLTVNNEYWEGLTSYPVPIHSLPDDYDALLEVTKKCNRYKALFQQSIASERYQKVMQKYENMTLLVEKNTGYRVTTLDEYLTLYTDYDIEESKGLKLPDWVTTVYPFPMIEPTVVSLIQPTWSDELKRFRGGPFVKEVLGNFRAKLDGSSSLNMSLYSAHDTSLSAAMNTMGIFNDAPPPFAALLLIELRMPENCSEPVVTIWYKNSTMDPFLLELPNCGTCCPLGQMEQQLKPVIPDDWEKECKEDTSELGVLSEMEIKESSCDLTN